MSGMIPDLASWALRGQRGNNNEEEDGDNNNEDGGNTTGSTTQQQESSLTAAELREQRVQRMALLQQRQQEAASSGPEPMEVEPQQKPASKPPAKKAAPVTTAPPAATATTVKKKRKAEKDNDPARKLQRKKELLLRKVLGVVLTTPSSPTPPSLVTESPSLWTMEVEDPSADNGGLVNLQTIAEILSHRVSLSPNDLPRSSKTSSSFLLAYLADCHRKAAEELKLLRSAAANDNKKANNNDAQQQQDELTELLQEIQKQVVSYAATVLMEPDLFEQGHDSVAQLSRCLLTSLTDLSASITFGVGGNNASSFYFQLVQELALQDASALERVVRQLVASYRHALVQCDGSILDNTAVPSLGGANAGGDNSALAIVSALTALCMHKKVAELVTQTPDFLLPAAASPQAVQMVQPPPPPAPNASGGANSNNRLLQQFMASLQQQQQAPAYKKRSGPALEKATLLGLVLRAGIPTKNNAAFAPQTILRQSLAAVESSTSQQRQQLRSYQEACNQWLHTLIKAGPNTRQAVLAWFTDALLVNVAAAATRPDPTKVSSSTLLLNMSVCLLKLCDPFVSDPKKHYLIDCQYCSVPAAHGGVYTLEGDHAVQRLDRNLTTQEQLTAASGSGEYNPKNAFVTQLFFLTARAIHFGLASALSQHEQLLRHLSHLHWMITSRGSGADSLQSDPHFAMYVSRQRSSEVALLEEEVCTQHLQFLQLVAKVLVEMKDDDEILRRMPEDFVSDVCHVITSLAKVKPRLLRGIDVSYTFKLVVKLLSPQYATMVRNYHLRATLGDVLYELFLPPSTERDRRESVPTSVYVDSRTGETYLLSDAGAQETLAPSLLLLYGEVEHTGYYDRMSHRAKISSLIKYLWESSQHRPAFRRITQNKDSFVKFANGIMNETNTLIATVMQKLPEIREAQTKMKDTQEWGALTEEQQKQISERLEENEREVKHALPLCNKTLQMFGYLNTDEDIRKLFLLEELCSRLVSMLLHVLTKLVGSKGLELKVDNPEELDFKPKVMLRDLCYIFSLFAKAPFFQEECAKSGGDPALLRQALRTVKRLNLLTGDELDAFAQLPEWMEAAAQRVAADEALLENAPDEFLDEILSTFMKDPVLLPSGHTVDRSTITQHLLNDPMDPFNRNPMTIDDIKPHTELKQRMEAWLAEKRQAAAAAKEDNAMKTD